MKTTTTNRPYLSFWLVPYLSSCEVLQSIINRLADQRGTQTFLPHVTLCSGPAPMRSPEDQSWSVRSTPNWSEILFPIITPIVDELHPFKLEIEQIRYGHQFSKTVFIQLRSTKTLVHLVTQIQQALHVPFQHPDPHVSLLYCTLEDERKRLIAQSIDLSRIALDFDRIQVMQAPATFQTQQDVAALRCIYATSIKKTT